MVSLKRNSKLELVEAKGIRSRASSIYTPDNWMTLKLVEVNLVPSSLVLDVFISTE